MRFIALENLPKTNFKEARKNVGYGARKLIIEALRREKKEVGSCRLDQLQEIFMQLYAKKYVFIEQAIPWG